ncbi:MAG: Bacterial regulatory helix-turn-helix protein, lysR family [Methanomassiliicoccales archaeon PtaU1.Bin124]|nr:MAG: Bacterial regulatory helix-turn-helix protein, lysR family [Methanomassiliicoccales archaeon PtaU1.Bin124]
MGQGVKLEPSVSLRVNGVELTPHQLEVILAIYQTGSQKAAAARMKVATPVLHRYLHQIEAKCGQRLAETKATGTELNEEGEAIAKEYLALQRRLGRGEKVVVGCTPVTEELLFTTLSAINDPSAFQLVISDDERNMQEFQARLMDLVVLDDPLYAYEIDGLLWDEVAEDRLIHVERSAAYGKYRYGAQRIGFKYLDTRGDRYRIERLEHSLASLIRSNMSFFVNESLVMRKGLTLRSSTDPDQLKHKILAVYWEEGPSVDVLLKEMKKRTLGNADLPK